MITFAASLYSSEVIFTARIWRERAFQLRQEAVECSGVESTRLHDKARAVEKAARDLEDKLRV